MNDREYLQHAVNLGLAAAETGEYPIGAVLATNSGQILAAAANQSQATLKRLQHAEVRVLQVISPRNIEIEQPPLILYSSLEPCLMCFGAAIVARISRIVWACNDPFGGAGVLLDHWPLPHLPIPEVVAEPFPDLREASRCALVRFFAENHRHDILRVWQNAGYS